jgi:hypothetical protein
MDVRLHDRPFDPAARGDLSPNATRLHELYVTSLGSDGVTMEPATKLALDAHFDSAERWRDGFSACAMDDGAPAGACYLRGGIDGWQAAGRPLAGKARP